MSTKPRKSGADFVDPDDAPEWTDDQLDRAELAIGGEVVRPAQGSRPKRGRPRLAAPMLNVSLRLEPEVIEAYRATGDGWHKRMGDVLRAGVERNESGRYTVTSQFAGPLKSVARKPRTAASKSTSGRPR